MDYRIALLGILTVFGCRQTDLKAAAVLNEGIPSTKVNETMHSENELIMGCQQLPKLLQLVSSVFIIL